MKEIVADNEELTSWYFDHGLDVNLQFVHNKIYEEKTPIHIAAEKGSLNVLLALISRGAGVDPLDREWRTPLTLAIENNRFACARSLIELGSDIEKLDSYGRTPLMYACKLGNTQTVQMLLSYSADVNVKNKTGDSCMSFA